MLKINKKVEYALIALKFMAERGPEKLTSAREICQKFKTPFDTTAKVLQIMNNHEVLTSVKGIKGGYEIVADLTDLKFMQLVRMIEGREYSCQCDNGHKRCELIDHCNIVSPVEQLSQRLTAMLESLSLQELLFGNTYNYASHHLNQTTPTKTSETL